MVQTLKETLQMERNQGHILSNICYFNPIIISLTIFISPSVRSLTSADYCASPLTQNTTVSVSGISPKRVALGQGCIYMETIRKTDSRTHRLNRCDYIQKYQIPIKLLKARNHTTKQSILLCENMCSKTIWS